MRRPDPDLWTRIVIVFGLAALLMLAAFGGLTWLIQATGGW